MSLILAAVACAQPPLYVKPGAARAAGWSDSELSTKRKSASRRHLIVQFAAHPEEWQLSGLARRGVVVVGYVPENGLAVSAPDDARLDEWLGVIRASAFVPEGKISTPVTPGGTESSHWIVDFHADTEPGAMREIVNETGFRIQEHPDLLRHQLMVACRSDELLALSGWDEVAYIYPASQDLAEGRPVVACPGATTEFAGVGQYVARVGKGWSGGASGETGLQYHFSGLTAKLPADQTRAEIERALAEWARHVKINFVPGSSAAASRTINILFAPGGHGDPFPFDGRGKALAHTFYPSPPNPEPLAGDVHLDEDENWRIGADTDLYSVALHELGHALGLGHSDNPGAVMYPFYRRAEALTAEDVSALRTLYPAREQGVAHNPTPSAEAVRLTVIAPANTTAASSIPLEGTLSGGTPPLSLSWSTDRGAAGTADAAASWKIPAVPLSAGRNVITVTATDARQERVAESISILREVPAAPQPAADTVPPALTIQSPAGTNALVAAASVTLRGSARDNTGVAQVSWSSSSGRSGTAQGTASWTVPELPLLLGANTVTVRARDAAGNVSWRSVVITRR